MCLLALRLRTVPGVPLALAANRDESLARAFDPPRLHDGPVPFLAPVDRKAGGTWIGLNAAGLAVALTNRPQREPAPGGRSRGLLALDALRAGSLDRLRDALDRHLRGQRAVYDNFHLLAASADGAFVVRYHDGWTEVTELDRGDHFLTNEDELDAPAVGAVTEAAAGDAAAEAARLQAALRGHGPDLPGGRAVCKHGEGRGTLSATVIALPGPGVSGAVFRFAAGPPCATEFRDFAGLLP